MTAALTVVAPGLATTVQDIGRVGFQRQGVPVSGALDRLALAAANVVVGNAPGEAAFEMLYQGAVLTLSGGTARIAVAGCGATLEIVDDAGTRRIGPLETVTIGADARAKVTIAGPGIVAYLAVAGGLDLPAVMGSRATYARARIGGLHGTRLAAGDRLALSRSAAPTTPEATLSLPPFVPPAIVRVVLGPQDDYFTPETIQDFLSTAWRVTPASDRMGVRLDGPPLTHARGHDIVSDGIAPGAIQIPGDGRPIILLADRQTTGGYPKIATVISTDVPALGRLAPGMAIRFEAITVAAAEDARRRLEAETRQWPGRVVHKPAGGIDTALLLTANLIDGVIDAHGSSAET